LASGAPSRIDLKRRRSNKRCQYTPLCCNPLRLLSPIGIAPVEDGQLITSMRCWLR
jgi:hypothetical protein